MYRISFRDKTKNYSDLESIEKNFRITLSQQEKDYLSRAKKKNQIVYLEYNPYLAELEGKTSIIMDIDKTNLSHRFYQLLEAI